MQNLITTAVACPRRNTLCRSAGSTFQTTAQQTDAQAFEQLCPPEAHIRTHISATSTRSVRLSVTNRKYATVPAFWSVSCARSIRVSNEWGLDGHRWHCLGPLFFSKC